MAVSAKPIDAGLTNHEIVTLSVFLLGGETQPIDTEHVAFKAAELAPGRYNWRFYPDQINIELVRTFLSDAKKSRCGSYLTGSTKKGWMLTEAGALFAKHNEDRLRDANLKATRKTDSEKKWYKRERMRLLGCPAFAKFKSGDVSDITARDAASFFRLDEYVKGTARERKIARIVNNFRDVPELGEAVLTIRRIVTKTNSQ